MYSWEQEIIQFLLLTTKMSQFYREIGYFYKSSF